MRRKVLFYFIMLGLLFLVLEAFGYVTFYIFDDIYDHRKKVLQNLKDDGRIELKLKRLDPELGWNQSGPQVERVRTCQDKEVIYTSDQNGARVYDGYNGDLATVVLVGDSYTHGADVAADDTYAAQLSKLMNTPVTNLGVGGFGPVQAFLNLKQKLSRYPEARVVILGIMYENIFRMVNSYRPVLAEKSSPYRIKSYISQGEIRKPGPEVLGSIDDFLHYASAAFDHDFWAKPQHRFPFTQAFLSALISNYVYYKRLPRKLRKIGIPEYYLAYRSDSFSRELVSLLEQFTKFARKHQVEPVVVFIPRDKYDTKSVSQFIRMNNDQLPNDLLIIDVGEADIDWTRYNLLDRKEIDNINICHPSPYGHTKIALTINRALQREH
ncbi:MAG: hypothetical protein PVG35_02355 [Desulfobacterales bacterium]|jgi:hypothetical protein